MNRAQDWTPLAGERAQTGLHEQRLATTPAEVVLVSSGTCHFRAHSVVGAGVSIP